MIEMNNSTGKINGYKYDFTGYNATLGYDGKIIKVVEMSTGKDCTERFKQKYGQLQIANVGDVVELDGMFISIDGLSEKLIVAEVKIQTYVLSNGWEIQKDWVKRVES